MAFIRWFLGKILLTLNFLTTPRGIKRAHEEQVQIDKKTHQLALYQFHACPFCIKVRRAMKRYSLNIELRDAKKAGQFRQELSEQGGQIKVPCLRITNEDGSTSWMYESNDIIRYLEKKFVHQSS
ncbi:glutathione S-transferase N-terminal domain-containing protein [Neptunomonas sp.]|uniref:glutathione S-transferase N-terminal domain-containing protein n=1 Tax=Neptunomonas sp. TaxID=1971898 RepID=UPI003568B10B